MESCVKEAMYEFTGFCRLLLDPSPKSQLNVIICIEPVSLGVDWLVKDTANGAQPCESDKLNATVGFGYTVMFHTVFVYHNHVQSFQSIVHDRWYLLINLH